MKQLLAQITLLILLTTLAFGESVETLPSFEAADVHVSVRSWHPMNPSGFIRSGRYQFRNATMADLIASAYGVEADKVLGGPSWLEWDAFDVLAKAPASTKNDAAKLMLRSLLADRFNLVVHNEDQPATVYVMTGTPGPQLREAKTPGSLSCQSQSQPSYEGIACKNVSMSFFVQNLPRITAGYIENPIVDLTGLQGNWDFELKWTPHGQLAAAGKNGISLFDALEKQLGIKLELQNRASRAIVVDRVNRKPTDNAPGVEKLLPVVSLEFEVADIKPSTQPEANRPMGGIQPGGRIDLAAPLKYLIMTAWDFNQLNQHADELLIGPKWLESERFEIVARAPADVSIAETNLDVDALLAMLRNLLIDRFKMKFHYEDQPISVYALLSPKRESKLKHADPSVRASCKRTMGGNAGGVPLFTMTCRNATMAQFAESLSGRGAPGLVESLVIDSTGLDGGWDFTLNWTPDFIFNGGAPGRPPDQTTGGPAAASDPNGGISLPEAIEKQLGLKLELQKHPMPVLVIDHIEQKPTDN